LYVNAYVYVHILYTDSFFFFTPIFISDSWRCKTKPLAHLGRGSSLRNTDLEQPWEENLYKYRCRCCRLLELL